LFRQVVAFLIAYPAFSVQDIKTIASLDGNRLTGGRKTTQLFGTDRDMPFSLCLFPEHEAEAVGGIIAAVYTQEAGANNQHGD
jgi:hypothetical protein